MTVSVSFLPIPSASLMSAVKDTLSFSYTENNFGD